MFETISTFVVDWVYRQCRRFGWWLLSVPAVIVLVLGAVLARGCAQQSERRAHSGFTAEQWKKYHAAAANEETVNAAEILAARNKAAADRAAKERAMFNAAKPAPGVAAKAAVPPAKVAAPPPKPVHPAILDEWTPADFLAARAEGDPRLPAAVACLGTRSKGDLAAAALLVLLLRAPGPAPAIPGGPVVASKPLAESLVAALAANGTRVARETLRAIVQGKWSTPDDRAATVAALGALAASGEPQDEALLLTALTAPEGLRPPPAPGQPGGGFGPVAPGPLGADELQRMAAAGVRSAGSAALRLQLARYLVRPDTPPSSRALLVPCLEDPRIENVAAQVVLYASEEIDAAVRGRLEQRFAALSSEALGRGLRLPASQITPAAVGATVQPGRVDLEEAAPPRLAPAAGPLPLDPLEAVRWLWSDALAETLDRRLSLVESLAKARGTLVFCATVPSPAARASLYRVLGKHWYEGPAAGGAADAWVPALSDPALLLVLKGLPRKGLLPRPPEHHAGKHAAKPVPGVKAKANFEADIKHKRELAEQGWIDRSEQLVRNWCARLRSAALAGQAPSRTASVAVRTAEVPLALHPKARPLVIHHCDWPGGLAEKVPAAVRDPLEMYYVRTEEKNRIERVMTYYHRQWESGTERAIKGGAWLDYCGKGAQADRKRSIDMIITRAAPDAPALAGEEMDLVVEILWIEAKDPALGAEALVDNDPP
jgi:hypothetical protein